MLMWLPNGTEVAKQALHHPLREGVELVGTLVVSRL